MSDARPQLPYPLLTVAAAVRAIGGRSSVVRAWLTEQGLVRDVPGLGRRVSWREVLDRVESGGGPREDRPVRGRLPRVRLGG